MTAKQGSTHYTAGMPQGLEPIDLIRAQGWAKNFALGNAQKYLSRAEHKGSFERDIQKAIDYLNEALEVHRLEEASIAKQAKPYGDRSRFDGLSPEEILDKFRGLKEEEDA